MQELRPEDLTTDVDRLVRDLLPIGKPNLDEGSYYYVWDDDPCWGTEWKLVRYLGKYRRDVKFNILYRYEENQWFVNPEDDDMCVLLPEEYVLGFGESPDPLTYRRIVHFYPVSSV